MVNQDHMNEDYAKHFSEEKFWDKVLKFGKQAGVKLTYGALLLYYTFQKPTIPKATKATILGALGYFISPLDIIPDFIPLTGYVDDFGVVVTALLLVVSHIDTESRQLAKAKVSDWFGESAIQDTHALDEEIKKNQQEKLEKKAMKSQYKQEKKEIKAELKKDKEESRAQKEEK